jgi:hypothetical protein
MDILQYVPGYAEEIQRYAYLLHLPVVRIIQVFIFRVE